MTSRTGLLILVLPGYTLRSFGHGGPLHVAQTKEVMLCVHLILLPTIDQLLASTGCSPCSTRSAAWKGRAPSYPPYNIARTGENDYRISVAVAGFTDADLAIEAKENTLTLRARSRPTTGRRVATCPTRASPRGTSNVVSNRSAATSFVCTGPPQ